MFNRQIKSNTINPHQQNSEKLCEADENDIFWGGDVWEKNNFLCYFYCEKSWRGHYQTPTPSARGAVARALSTSVIKRMLPKIPRDDEFRYNSTPSPCPNTGSSHLGSREPKECAGGAKGSWNTSRNLAFGVCFPHLSDSQERAVSKRASGRADPACILEFWLAQIDSEVSS